MKVKLNPDKVHLYNESKDFRLGIEYTILAIDGEYYRLLPDEEGPYCYPTDLFTVTDSLPTLGWGTESAPDEFLVEGFFEDYFDNKRSIINTFNTYLARLGIQPERIVRANGKIVRPYRVEPPLPGTQTKKVKVKSDLPYGLVEPGYFIPNNEYIVLGMEGDQYYLLPENGDPGLFKQDFFVLTQAISTQEWTVIRPRFENESGEIIRTKRTCPRGLNALNFWRNYLNSEVDEINAFNLYYGPLGVPLYRIVQADGTVVKLDKPVFHTT